jgi:hypothetical protein
MRGPVGVKLIVVDLGFSVVCPRAASCCGGVPQKPRQPASMDTVPLMRHVVTYWFWVGFLRRRPQEPYFSRRQRRSPRLTVQEPGFDLPFSFNLDDGGRSLSSPALANGVVYVGGGFNVSALNASTERETAKYLQIHGRRSNHGLDHGLSVSFENLLLSSRSRILMRHAAPLRRQLMSGRRPPPRSRIPSRSHRLPPGEVPGRVTLGRSHRGNAP